MLISFRHFPVTVVVCPTDLRCGYHRLAEYARLVGVDVNAGGHFVVFVSKTRCVCKIICCDENGTVLITRRLHRGRFEQLLARVQGPACVSLSESELENYLNGQTIFSKKETFW